MPRHGVQFRDSALKPRGMRNGILSALHLNSPPVPNSCGRAGFRQPMADRTFIITAGVSFFLLVMSTVRKTSASPAASAVQRQAGTGDSRWPGCGVAAGTVTVRTSLAAGRPEPSVCGAVRRADRAVGPRTPPPAPGSQRGGRTAAAVARAANWPSLPGIITSSCHYTRTTIRSTRPITPDLRRGAVTSGPGHSPLDEGCAAVNCLLLRA